MSADLKKNNKLSFICKIWTIIVLMVDCPPLKVPSSLAVNIRF